MVTLGRVRNSEENGSPHVMMVWLRKRKEGLCCRENVPKMHPCEETQLAEAFLDLQHLHFRPCQQSSSIIISSQAHHHQLGQTTRSAGDDYNRPLSSHLGGCPAHHRARIARCASFYRPCRQLSSIDHRKFSTRASNKAPLSGLK